MVHLPISLKSLGKRLGKKLVILVLGLSAAGCHERRTTMQDVSAVPAGYHLVWDDEFDKAGLPDSKKWNYDTYANGQLWWHNEREYYTEGRMQNARIEDGRLIIEARQEDMKGSPDWAGQEYSSARLITRGKQDWTYGFFEIRAKLPCGRGVWPAIWLLSSTGRWPNDGEIDIMEQVGHEPGRIHATLHHTATNAGTAAFHGMTDVGDSCNAFHNYQLDWRKDSITALIDGKPIMHADKGSADYAQWPWDHKFYLILNIAVGGAWGGAKGIDPAALPAQMEVDYVRVYQPG